MARAFELEWNELEKIDFLLNELARAVERGEIRRSDYDVMVPRHFARRAALVAIITGAVRDSVAVAPVASVPAAASAAHPAAATPVRRRTEPVKWTTVLLFLGAFLVIVASAIFAIVMWQLFGPTGRLAFLGALTAGFYAGGWWAREKADIPVGATALTAVASAMLLFDGWIAIQGYRLEGMLPWAVLLLVCSIAYWATEVWLADRFFGVIGAAAQMAWWWLLGEGLHVDVPVRLAGMALVALAWSVAGERGRHSEALSPLARVLDWAAPVAVALLSFGMLFEVENSATAGNTELASAAVIAAVAAAVIYRVRPVAPLHGEQWLSDRHWVVAILQVPLILTAWTAASAHPDSWAPVAVFAGMALVYGIGALYLGGPPYAIVALASEFSFFATASDVLHVGQRATLAVLAGLAVSWAVASRLSSSLADRRDAPRGALGVARVSEIAAIGLLSACSVAVPFISSRVALAGPALGPADALLAVTVALAWRAVLLVRPREVTFAGLALYSVYAAAAAMSWGLPGQASATYAALLVVVAGVWIALAGLRPDPRFDPSFSAAVCWAGRLLTLLFTMFGLLLESFTSSQSTMFTWPGVVLAGVAAVVFAADAIVLGTVPSAGLSAALAVGTAALVGGIPGEYVSGPDIALAGAGMAALVAVAVVLGDRRDDRRRLVAAVSAAAVGTLVATTAWESPGRLALALLLAGIAWTCASVGWHGLFAAPAGLAFMGAAAALGARLDAGPWATVAVLAVAALSLGGPAFTTTWGPHGSRRDAGAAFAFSGAVGLGLSLALGWSVNAAHTGPKWIALGNQTAAFGLLVLGATMLVQAVRWTFEPALYAGWGVILLAGWAQVGVIEDVASEAYTTTLALYLAGMGHLYSRRDETRAYPIALDAAAVLVALGLPLMWALTEVGRASSDHALWVLGLSLAAIVLGIASKVRWYFFGGVTALALVAAYRSFSTLAEFWWLVLGVVGIAMLVVALTWERQRETRDRLLHSFEGWR